MDYNKFYNVSIDENGLATFTEKPSFKSYTLPAEQQPAEAEIIDDLKNFKLKG